MTRRPLILLALVLAVPVVLYLGWFLLSPLFIDRTVDETFPITAEAPPAEPPPAAAPTETTMNAPATDAANEADESPEMPEVDATATMAAAAAEPDTVMEEPMPEATGPRALVSGAFYDIVHAGSGQATIYELEDGSRLLRFEDFQTDNGPDLHVWLVPVDPVPNAIGSEIPGYVDLGKLKGNVGNQNYEIPADLDLSQFQSVVVWCMPFRVPFTAAPLTPTEEASAPASDTAAEGAAPALALPDLGAAPELTNDVWLNSEQPIRLADLRGKVVVVEFWTFGCYNCQNVLPHVKQWHADYGGDEFQVVSVHYPEFNYEREIDNVRAAVQEFGVTYPVAIDNEGTTWRAYEQRYWPTWYVLDRNGHIRYKHIGEGGYDETEQVIQTLLAEPYQPGSG